MNLVPFKNKIKSSSILNIFSCNEEWELTVKVIQTNLTKTFDKARTPKVQLLK